MVACWLSGPLPQPITWGLGAADVTDDVIAFPPALHLATGLLRLTSALRLPHGAQGRTYTCSVPHSPTNTVITKEVKACEVGGQAVPPEVRVLSSTSCNPSSLEEGVELLCLVSGFAPPPVEMEWLVDGVPGDLPLWQSPPRPEEGATTYAVTGRTNVSHHQWAAGRTFTCQVKHAATGSVTQGHARFCPDLENPNVKDIRLYVLPPAVADLYVTRHPKVRCLATNLPSDSGFQLSWVKEKPGVLHPDFLDLREQFNGTFTATSTLSISTQDWEGGERFTCTVKHADLQVPLNKSISRRSGKVTSPLIFVLPPHPEELTHQEVTLTCLVRAFQPENVEVQWLKNHQKVPEEDYVTTPPLREGPTAATFFIYSKMTVLKVHWSGGDIYTCMVVHEGLPMKFTQRQIQKNPGN